MNFGIEARFVWVAALKLSRVAAALLKIISSMPITGRSQARKRAGSTTQVQRGRQIVLMRLVGHEEWSKNEWMTLLKHNEEQTGEKVKKIDADFSMIDKLQRFLKNNYYIEKQKPALNSFRT